MNTREAYNHWASQYDTNDNKTRDLEAQALRSTLSKVQFANCLEIGCGTGKNTAWLVDKANSITAVDLSEEMLAKAKEKVGSAKVNYRQADITTEWAFAKGPYDLVTFSLVLEHIDNLDHIFSQTAKQLRPGGYVYVGELHPFKQYSGSKARFETEQGVQVVECFNHNISDFVQTAKKYGLDPVDVNEYFDEDDRSTLPRILVLLLQKRG
jgi:2-polyprenyl-3-methyl-5-hydroxy-6-metoxy-1,4-benzoquinol methylase